MQYEQSAKTAAGHAFTPANTYTLGTNAGGTNVNVQTTGAPYHETGRRVVEVALRYNFWSASRDDRDPGCPTLAASLLLRLGWAPTDLGLQKL